MNWRRHGVGVGASLLLLALVGVAAADTELTPHRATYKVKISVLGGELKSRLELKGGEYFVSSTVNPRGLTRLISRGSIQERSRFATSSGTVRSISYTSTDTLSSKGQEVEMSFDWDAMEVLGVVDTQPIQIPLSHDAIDRASLQYALMHDLLNDRLRPEYVLLESEGAKDLTVTIKGEKTIEVPYGEYDVIGIVHKTESSSRETILWCAPTLGFLPVVIEQYRDGKVRGRVVLTEYEVL